MRWPMTLKEYCELLGTQRAVARSLQISTPTISQMLSQGRNILVLPDQTGAMTYYEIRGQKNAAKPVGA